MLTAKYQKYVLDFLQPAGTSRGIMNQRTSWFLRVNNSAYPDVYGIGECAPLPGLSRDKIDNIEEMLEWVCTNIDERDLIENKILWDYPSLLFGLETALLDLKNGGKKQFYNNTFLNQQSGIPINGLVWMGSIEMMREQIHKKIADGYSCIKLKIGANNIESELNLIEEIRNTFGWEIEIRVDANGSLFFDTCMPSLKKLADLQIHSIEQPLPSGQHEKTLFLCKNSPIPIALDEDIICWTDRFRKYKLLDSVKPKYIVLKPGLIGGFAETTEWINLANERSIGWWITSALESNIGLNAIAQYTSQFQPTFPQGLGTGKVFKNNFASPLYIDKIFLFHNTYNIWDLTSLKP